MIVLFADICYFLYNSEKFYVTNVNGMRLQSIYNSIQNCIIGTKKKWIVTCKFSKEIIKKKTVCIIIWTLKVKRRVVKRNDIVKFHRTIRINEQQNNWTKFNNLLTIIFQARVTNNYKQLSKLNWIQNQQIIVDKND